MKETLMDLILDNSVEIMLFQIRTWLGCVSFTVDSLLTDTCVKRTLRVGPCLSLLPYLTLFMTDTSLRQTLSARPKGVRLRES